MTLDPASFVLGMVALVVVAYAVWAWKSERVAGRVEAHELAAMKSGHDGLVMANTKRADEIAGLTARVVKLEAALRIDGARIMATANKNNIPTFMKGPGE